MIEELLKQYSELQEQEESLKTKKDELKTKIVEQMKSTGTLNMTTKDGIKASVIARETYKYTDEQAIIKYLNANNMGSYITMKVNSTALNKQLKASQTLTESLQSYFTKTISDTLKVEKK